MPWWMLNNKPLFAPADGAGSVPAAGDPAPAEDNIGTVLYPNDPPKADGDKPANPPAEGKEYVSDPSKSDEENAAAKAEHDKTKPADGDLADKVPEDGKYSLKMPEGVEVDQALLDAVSPDFKELGLTQKQAQTLADKFIAAQTKKGEEAQASWSKTLTDWVDQAKADPEIGGANWDGTVKVATQLVGRFGNEAFCEYLNASGAGNHPEMIRFMAKVGAVIGEDRPANPANPGKTVARDTAAILYPDDQPKGK
ncbi:MAG: hypothetical protein IT544_00470 [Rhodobacteraceae bacterium]|nr:hypothetical protein [Paracoccaceae bacterium]